MKLPQVHRGERLGGEVLAVSAKRAGINMTALAVGALGLTLAACAGSGSTGNALPTGSSPGVTLPGGENSPSQPQASPTWSLPGHKDLDPKYMTQAGCLDHFWTSQNPQPMVQEDPPIARVDARCSPPLDDDRVGVYPRPSQHGPSSFVVRNGDFVGEVCTTQGEWITNNRNDGSTTWVWVFDQGGRHGYIPETNLSFSTPKKRLTDCNASHP